MPSDEQGIKCGMAKWKKLAHVVYQCSYHIVWTPNYRFRILEGDVAKEIESKQPPPKVVVVYSQFNEANSDFSLRPTAAAGGPGAHRLNPSGSNFS